jgi:hypothetical protein
MKCICNSERKDRETKETTDDEAVRTKKEAPKTAGSDFTMVVILSSVRPPVDATKVWVVLQGDRS